MTLKTNQGSGGCPEEGDTAVPCAASKGGSSSVVDAAQSEVSTADTGPA